MGYTIDTGIPEAALPAWLAHAAQRYGTFDDGRVDYSHADTAPIVMCIVTWKDHILLAKRGQGLADAEGYWSTINGFIDEPKPVAKQAQQEIKEELRIAITLDQVTVRPSYTLQNPREKRVYIVFPCLISLDAKPSIVLDAEHTDFAWIVRNDLTKYETLDDLPYAIDSALGRKKT